MSVEVDSQHSDMVHDAQFDYYCKQLATCSSDKTIRIHAVDGNTVTSTAVLKGHSGPVWQVSWSHPSHGSLLASCSYDGKVIIWKNSTPIHEHDFHSASVNSVAWAPSEYGPVVGCASSDGQVSILEYKQDTWSFTSFVAHSVGVNSISFTTATEGDLMCVTGGCDNLVKVWKLSQGQWSSVATLDGHSDWVRSVAWSPVPVVYSPMQHIIVSCSQDKTVCLWSSTDLVNWEKKQVLTFGYPLWRVSWSVTGHLLAVSGAADNVAIYGVDTATGEWTQVSSQPL